MPNANVQNPFPGAVDEAGFQRIEGSCSTHTALSLFKGNLQCQVSVVNIQTVGAPLSLTLTYDSLTPTSVPVGNGWRHNLMMSLNITGTVAVFVNASGKAYGFTYDGTHGVWVLSNTSPFIAVTLTGPDGSGGSRLTFHDGSYLAFNNLGQLTQSVDAHGNVLQMTYSSGHLITATEPTGRSITLAYTGSYLTSVTDPKGNLTTLIQNGNGQLTNIVGPEGCITSFTYADPSTYPGSYLMTSRTDATGHSYGFAYDDSLAHRVASVLDSEGNRISYSYLTNVLNEYLVEGAIAMAATQVLDTRGNLWEYRFDSFGNLRRAIDPLGHQRHYHWDTKQNPMFQSNGFRSFTSGASGTLDGPWDNFNNQFRLNSYDPNNGLLLYQTDATGMATAYTWDMDDYGYGTGNLLSVHPGQAHFGLGGNWQGQFGQDGWLLCAYDGTDSAPQDRVSLPDYVQSITTDATLERDTDAHPDWCYDPRAVCAPDSLSRGLGFWKASTGFNIKIKVKGRQSFNLSFYTHCAEFAIRSTQPMRYGEQTGRALFFNVTDALGQQSYRVDNTSPGAWVTFPVTADDQHPVQINVPVWNWVVVSGIIETEYNTVASVSAIMFDPYYDRRVRYSYNSTSDLVQIDAALGRQIKMTYNSDGTLATRSEIVDSSTALQTQYFYGDTYKNLTSVVDANGKTTSMTYDLNGNVLTLTDPNGNTTSFTYDGKDRLLTSKDAQGHVTRFFYDLSGRLVQVVDPLNNGATMTYTAAGRLATTTDSLARVRQFTYDSAGNLISMCDPLNNVVTLAYDAANNPVLTVLPDGSQVTYAYDELDQLAAVTPPDGNQSDSTMINVTGAMNWLQNPGAEQASPFDLELHTAQYWSGVSDINQYFVRHLKSDPDPSLNSPVHSGDASFNILAWADGSERFKIWQDNIPFPAGAKGLVRAWSYVSGSDPASSVRHDVFTRDFYGNAIEHKGGLMLVGNTWSQTPFHAFQVDGDAQYTRFPLSEYRLYGIATGASAYAHIYVDDLEMFSLSHALKRDGEKRVISTIAPDGTNSQLVRDRFGRVARTVDGRGSIWQMAYDALDRPSVMVDPLGNVTTFQYDTVGNLVTMSSARGAMRYAYDNMHRLITLTYADGTTEQFSYDDGGRLSGYTNNRAQSRTYAYDTLNRLTTVTYATDSSHVTFVYDVVGNVLARTERNGDQAFYAYDNGYRVIKERFAPGGSSASTAWTHQYQYDANNNILSFNDGGDGRYNAAHYNVDNYRGPAWQALGTGLDGTSYPDGAKYDVTRFDIDPFAVNAAVYGTSHADFDFYDYTSATMQPGARYDAMNRLSAVRDAGGNLVVFAYDVEGRRTRATRPNGSVVTQASYDIVGRLKSLNTTVNGTPALSLGYCHDKGSNPLCLTTDNDTIDYVYDDNGRLVEERRNRFAQYRHDEFRLGTGGGVSANPTNDTVSLVPIGDPFTDLLFNADRWRTMYNDGSAYGLEIRQGNGLEFSWPRGFTNLIDRGTFSTPYDYLTSDGNVFGGLENRTQLVGDFDVQVDFADFEMKSTNYGVYQAAALMIHDVNLARAVNSATWSVYVARANAHDDHHSPLGQIFDGYYRHPNPNPYIGGTEQVNITPVSSSVPSGRLRITRVGSQVTAYYDAGSGWVSYFSLTFMSNPVYVSLLFKTTSSVAAVRFLNFNYNGGVFQPLAAPDTTNLVNSYTSAVYDAGRAVDWTSLSWTGNTPEGAGLGFQVAVASYPTGDPTNGWNIFTGPSGGSSFFTSPQSLAGLSLHGRYARYRAFFTTDGTHAAVLAGVTLDYKGALPSSRVQYGFTGGDMLDASFYDTAVFSNGLPVDTYDGAFYDHGTLELSTGDDLAYRREESAVTGLTVDVRDNVAWPASDRINGLDQIQRRDVTTSNGSVSWRYTYDNSGNLTSKTSGTRTWSYSWDEDNRLTQVGLPDGRTVSYTYDVAGRMLTRTDLEGTVQFEWDGMDMIRERSGSSQAAYDSANFDATASTYAYAGATTWFVVNGELLSFQRQGKSYNVFGDALGSVRLVTDSSGATVFSATYDAWGCPLTVVDQIPGGMPYRFTGIYGCRFDSATGLTYMRQRWYSGAETAGLQRFVSRDPIGGQNRYAYAGNNPETFFDPSGLDATWAQWMGGALSAIGQGARLLVTPVPPAAGVAVGVGSAACIIYYGAGAAWAQHQASAAEAAYLSTLASQIQSIQKLLNEIQGQDPKEILSRLRALLAGGIAGLQRLGLQDPKRRATCQRKQWDCMRKVQEDRACGNANEYGIALCTAGFDLCLAYIGDAFISPWVPGWPNDGI